MLHISDRYRKVLSSASVTQGVKQPSSSNGDQVPVVMFYPGKYDGQALMLFSKIKDDNYYRAFRLVD